MEEKRKQSQIGDILIGKVTKVRPYAAFLSFEGKSNGLLHISEINGGFIRDIEKYLSVGDEVRVKVIDIDSSNGFLRVSMKEVPEDEKYSSHQNHDRSEIIVKENEFDKIKESLPKWIKSTLEEAEKKND